MNQAIFNQEKVLEISAETITDLKRQAVMSETRRVRLCLHESPDAFMHEMINVFCHDTYIRPHRHPEGKPESYHIIEGQMRVFIFNEQGEVIRKVHLAEYGRQKSFILRMAPGIWHMGAAVTDYVVFKETFVGPFRKTHDVEYAPWSPDGNDWSEVHSFFCTLFDHKAK